MADNEDSKNKEDCKIVLYNVPMETTSEEVRTFLNDLDLNIHVNEIFLMTPRQPKYRGTSQISTLIGFIRLLTNHECDRVVKYFADFEKAHPREGVPFINKAQITGRLFANYCFVKDTTAHKKMLSRSNSQNFDSNSSYSGEQMEASSSGYDSSHSSFVPSDKEVAKELALEKVKWEAERRKLYDYIDYLEGIVYEVAPRIYDEQIRRR